MKCRNEPKLDLSLFFQYSGHVKHTWKTSLKCSNSLNVIIIKNCALQTFLLLFVFISNSRAYLLLAQLLQFVRGRPYCTLCENQISQKLIRLATIKPYCTFGYQSRLSSSLMILWGNVQKHLNKDFHVAALQHAAAERYH